METTSRAEADRDKCFDYIAERSAEGAYRWLEAYEDAVDSLLTHQFRGLAPESDLYGEDVRQRIFKTRHGLPYRLLFVVREQTIYVIHVRGPGQDLIPPDEIEIPPRE